MNESDVKYLEKLFNARKEEQDQRHDDNQARLENIEKKMCCDTHRERIRGSWIAIVVLYGAFILDMIRGWAK